MNVYQPFYIVEVTTSAEYRGDICAGCLSEDDADHYIEWNTPESGMRFRKVTGRELCELHRQVFDEDPEAAAIPIYSKTEMEAAAGS